MAKSLAQFKTSCECSSSDSCAGPDNDPYSTPSFSMAHMVASRNISAVAHMEFEWAQFVRAPLSTLGCMLLWGSIGTKPSALTRRSGKSKNAVWYINDSSCRSLCFLVTTQSERLRKTLQTPQKRTAVNQRLRLNRFELQVPKLR